MFNEVYDQLYKKNPDSLARKVNVAVPDPLHNKVTITENGEQDVVNYAVADIDIEDSGSGGGSFNNKKISITVVNNKSSMLMWTENYFISENGYVSSGTIEIPENSQIVRDLIIPIPIDSPNYYFGLPMINPSYDTVAASDPVNCTFNFSGGEQYLVVTDPTMDASITLTY